MIDDNASAVFPEDIDFSEAMERVYRAKKKASGTPIDLARRGGVSLLDNAENSAWLLNAIQQARATRDAVRDQRRRSGKDTEAMTRAMAMGQHAENIRNLTGGIGKLATEGVRHWATTGRRDMDQGDLRGSAKDLLAMGLIRKVPGGMYRYTPQGLFGEMLSPERMFGLTGEIDTLGIRDPNPGRGY